MNGDPPDQLTCVTKRHTTPQPHLPRLLSGELERRLPVPAEAPPHAPAEAYTLAAASVFLLLRATRGKPAMRRRSAPLLEQLLGCSGGLLLEMPQRQ